MKHRKAHMIYHFLLLPASSLIKLELDSKKEKGSQKRKLHIKDEQVASPTEEIIF